jgi:hypothetical protein
MGLPAVCHGQIDDQRGGMAEFAGNPQEAIVFENQSMADA